MNLLRFDTEQAWVDGVVALWCHRLRSNPALRMCLPSGNTPNKIYAAMGRAVKAGHASFHQAEIFALDDYGGLTPDDPGKCVNMLQRFLLDHIDLPRDRFHGIDVDAPDLEAMIRQYEARIGGGFDLTLLGIGLNGHLGLNEPGSPATSLTRRVDMHPATIRATASYLTHSNLPTWGVGVGLKHLLGSGEVWLLANTAAKSGIVSRAMKEAIGIELPASLLRSHPHSYLMVDSEAGANL